MERRKRDQAGMSGGAGSTGGPQKSGRINMAKRTGGRLPVQADPSVAQEDVADRAQDGSGSEGGGAGLDEGAGGESGARSGSDPEDSEPDPQAQQSELCGVQATAVERSGERMFRVGSRSGATEAQARHTYIARLHVPVEMLSNVCRAARVAFRAQHVYLLFPFGTPAGRANRRPLKLSTHQTSNWHLTPIYRRRWWGRRGIHRRLPHGLVSDKCQNQ